MTWGPVQLISLSFTILPLSHLPHLPHLPHIPHLQLPSTRKVSFWLYVVLHSISVVHVTQLYQTVKKLCSFLTIGHISRNVTTVSIVNTITLQHSVHLLIPLSLCFNGFNILFVPNNIICVIWIRSRMDAVRHICLKLLRYRTVVWNQTQFEQQTRNGRICKPVRSWAGGQTDFLFTQKKTLCQPYLSKFQSFICGAEIKNMLYSYTSFYIFQLWHFVQNIDNFKCTLTKKCAKARFEM